MSDVVDTYRHRHWVRGGRNQCFHCGGGGVYFGVICEEGNRCRCCRENDAVLTAERGGGDE